MRNSSLVERFCATNDRDLSPLPKLRLGRTTPAFRRDTGRPGVEERSMSGEGRPEGRLDGMEVSMHGMSSDNPDENSGRRKPKVSWGRFVRPGLVGT
jgi:hypothetical protein